MKTNSIMRLFLVLVLLLGTASIYAQFTVNGKVLDDKTGEPLSFANVVVVGTTVGVTTDLEGAFTLKVPEGSTQLSVSYIGYTDKTVDIGEQRDFTIRMGSGETLETVLLIGYAPIEKSDKTGAVVKVDADELNKGRLSDPIQALQGKAPGVNVSKQGGDPNAGFSVNIRGAVGFQSGSGPLYVVDGVPGVDPTTLNPEDIESIDILKDASSAAIYGSRGSNGVVIITTKGSNLSASKEPISTVEYTGFVSIDNVARRNDLLSAQQVRDFAASTGATFIDNGANVDWQDEIYRTGISQNHTLAFGGNTSKSSYRASLSANLIEGVMEGSSKNRYIGRLNFSQKVLKDRLTLQARISGTIEKNDYVNYGNGFSNNNVLYQTMRRAPTDPVRNPDGSFYESDRAFGYMNPVAIIEDIQNKRDAKRLLGNFRGELKIIEGLTAAVNLAYTRNDGESFYFEPSYTASNTTEGFGRRSYSNGETQLIETTINYRKTLKEKHSLNLLGGHSYQKEDYDGFAAQGKDAQSDLVTSNNLGALLLLEPGSISSYKNQNLLASFFGRAVYDFDKKYFVTATLRRDGSSKFGQNNEWGWFPSASAGWNIKRENFMNNVEFLSQLKLRVGYGITGNQEIGNQLDAPYYRPSGTAINPESGETVISFNNDGDINPNPDLKWEQNGELNLGLDFGFLEDKISGSIEYYRKTTKDLIYKYELPVPPNKNRFIYANAGVIENSGLEFSIQAFLLDKSNLKWKSMLNFSTNQQKTKKLSNDLYDLDEIKSLYVSGPGLVGGENWTQIIQPGVEIGTFFMPEYAGLSDDGNFLFFTEAGGVTRNEALAERRYVGSAQPDLILGWSNYFDLWKGIDLSFSLRSIIGHDIMNVTRMVFSNPADLPTLNVLQEGLDEYNRGLVSNPIISDYYLEDASFVKLDNIALGYTLKPKNTDAFQSIRFSLTGANLFTITGYSGVDPELSYGGLEFGLDQYDVYPKTRSFTFGVNATF